MLQKTTWMHFLLIGNFIVLLSACGQVDYIKTVSYDYKNNSGQDLVMEVYNYKNKFIRSFAIPDGDYVITNITRSEVPGVFYFAPDKNKAGESVIIRFKNNKCLYLNKNNNDRIFDIKRYDNFTEELIKQSEYRLTYIFKPEDYMQAVKCK